MSKISIKGADTGTGVFTLESPATNTDRTLTLPDEAGTVLTTATPGVPVNGPAFSSWVSSSNQTISHATFTKIALSVEGIDTNSNYDTSTYRFTPTVAGYYQINASISFLFAATGTWEYFGVFAKNGDTDYQRFGNQYQEAFASNPSARQIDGSTLLYFNGTTDYLELYAYQSSGSNASVIGTTATGKYTRISAFLARSA